MNGYPGRQLVLLLGWLSLATGCGSPAGQSELPRVARPKVVLRLATTTSTRDSGFLELIIPDFKRQANSRVDVIAVGSGAALKLGESGDADVLLVHAPAAEEKFMSAGFGSRRETFMYNLFTLVGPAADPAGVRGLPVVEALGRIAETGQRFVSRGDDSGTHAWEKSIWELAGRKPDWTQYIEAGQGMGATLTMADEMLAYTVADMGTYLKFHDRIELVPLIAASEHLRNLYSVIVVRRAPDDAETNRLAIEFADYLVSRATADRIAAYRIAGEPLFFPTTSSMAVR